MTQEDDLKKELRKLEKERSGLEEEHLQKAKIKHLKKKIRLEKFARTKKGKVFNAIGDFGLKFAKKIAAPPKQVVGKSKKRVVSVEEVMARLPK